MRIIRIIMLEMCGFVVWKFLENKMTCFYFCFPQLPILGSIGLPARISIFSNSAEHLVHSLIFASCYANSNAIFSMKYLKRFYVSFHGAVSMN